MTWRRVEESVWCEVFAFARPTRWPKRALRSCAWSRGGSRLTRCRAWPRPSAQDVTGPLGDQFIPRQLPSLGRRKESEREQRACEEPFQGRL